MSAFLPGFFLGLSLIIAIGAQNAFVLRQGLRGEHVMMVCFACATSDALLIAAGVAGFAAITANAPWIEPAFRYGGAAFLLVYSLRAFWSATRPGGALNPADKAPGAWQPVLGTTLALTWLNPHVYLDTLVLLGSISTQYPGAEAIFGIGAVTASFTFFFALGYGASLLRPIFAKPAAWRILDVIVGLVMLTIAVKLII
ncbi:MAG: amino acid transporter [Alphaproteobacteria bacterium]|nr:amino acid transporter [Alphaproteobacteria bacterium SS10]